MDGIGTPTAFPFFLEIAYGDQEAWVRMSILSVERMGRFSSDRSIREYCEKRGKVNPLKG